MDLNDLLVLLVRWVHGMGAVAWIGGNIFYLVVVRPSLREPGAPTVGRRIGLEYKGVVEISIWVIVITGVILIFDRLTSILGIAYALVLGMKLILFGVMALIALALGRRGPRRAASPFEGPWGEILPQGLAIRLREARSRLGRTLSPTNVLTVLGPAIILISILLRLLAGEG